LSIDTMTPSLPRRASVDARPFDKIVEPTVGVAHVFRPMLAAYDLTLFDFGPPTLLGGAFICEPGHSLPGAARKSMTIFA
jgi:hypothetical protein